MNQEGTQLNESELGKNKICEKFSPALGAVGRDSRRQILRDCPPCPELLVVGSQKDSRDKKTVLRAECGLFRKVYISPAVIGATRNTFVRSTMTLVMEPIVPAPVLRKLKSRRTFSPQPQERIGEPWYPENMVSLIAVHVKTTGL